mmetsp:Transcript_30627/g.35058  ORF Transcript_30627/g.35058 Transcript_30627/m.35058 type:complete len:121 (+) Transcript_30627:108-470(+)
MFLNKFVVKKCIAKEVYVIAHSRGGVCLHKLLTKFWYEFELRVKAIALTDSAHKDIRDGLIDQNEEDWLTENCKHFRRSDLRLGKKLDSMQDPAINAYSAGHAKHEYTTGTSWPLIQKFF